MAFEGLPEELMTLILAKLPVKSLLRFKCVQKSWYSLIKSPQFIRLHRSSSSSSPQFIIFREEPPRHILSSYSYETLDDLGNDIDIPISYRDRAGLSGSCDGLVCINNGNDQILICNPAIRELRLLSAPPSPGHVISAAFGSDPSTGQYKVVIFTVREGRRDLEAHVYDFRSDSWRETGVVIPVPFGYSDRAISLNGAFHWCPITWAPTISLDGFQRDDYSNILTFRFSDEVTGSIPLPDFLNVAGSKELCVISSKSLLSLIVYDFDLNLKGRFEIFVMTEYGVKESWTRLFQIGPLSDIYKPLGFWDEQQLLLLTMEGRQLVSYDRQHQNLRYFPIYGNESYRNFDVYSYSESLVSVNRIF